MKHMDQIHNGILRKYHTLCSRLGLTPDEKRAILDGCGVESSADLDTHVLIDICAKLSAQLGEGKASEMDLLRKRVFGAIGGYLRSMGYASSAQIIKVLACRATGYKDFNKIPAERLRNIYATFVNRQKDAAKINSMIDEYAAQTAKNNINNISIN